MIEKVLMAIVQTFLIFGLGAWIYHRKMISDKDLKTFTNVVMEIFFPLLTFSTITRNFNKDNLNELWIMPLAGFLIMFISFFIGLFFKRFMRNKNRRRLGTFHHICTINNYVFLPIIVLENIYSGSSSRHVALLLMMNVGSTIGLWTMGIIAFLGGTTFKRVWEKVCSVNVLAVFVAVGWSLLPWSLPSVIDKAVSSVGNMSVPFMLILIGGALYKCYHLLFQNIFDMIYLTFLRLIVVPFILLVILKFALHFFHLPTEIYQVLAIVAMMPTASSSVLFAKQYGGDEAFAGQSILATTILALPTMALWSYLFL